MTIVRVKGFKIYLDCRKKLRCYHRETGTPIDLKKTPIGSAEFLAECARIAELAKAKAAGKEKPGTLGLLICDYRKSPVFQDLAPRTRADYQGLFEYLRPIADTPITSFNRPLVVRIRDKAASTLGRRRGNYVKAVLSILFSWGRERGYLADNPASGIKDIRRQKGAPEANRPWSDQERDAVIDAAPAHMRPAIALMMFTGLGPKDALTLPRNFARSGEIATRRAKTGEPVFWPMPRPLAAILDQAPPHRRHNALRQFQGAAMDLERLRHVMAHLAIEARKRRADRTGPHPLRFTAYSGGHPSRVRLRRTRDRRCAGATNHRNGEALRQGRGPSREDARSREIV
jgi:hypothetical protein